MGSKNKLKKFKENLTFNNLFQPVRTELTNNYFKFKGFWNEYFKNDYPIILELGCGKGEYTCYLAKKHPKKNFIGIDIKGARIWAGAKYALENNINNAYFIRTQIELIELFSQQMKLVRYGLLFLTLKLKLKDKSTD